VLAKGWISIFNTPILQRSSNLNNPDASLTWMICRKGAAMYDYIVIGSGFGGSVSALRLAQKGFKVAVLEKGKRYRTQDFPPTNWNLRKFLWMPGLKFYGIQMLSLFKHVFVLHGCGVGGGSLVYANQLLVPPDEVFQKKEWGPGDWKNRLMPFYERAKQMLGAVSR